MVSHDVRNADSVHLAELMEFGLKAARIWLPEELKAIFEHQMSAPVQFDLAGLKDGRAGVLRALTEAEGLLIRSFRDLLLHPNPPLELLQLTKQFAKAYASHPDSPLPNELAKVL